MNISISKDRGIESRKEKGSLFKINEKVRISSKYKNFWCTDEYWNKILHYQDSLAGQEFVIESIEIDEEYYSHYILREDNKKIKWNEFLLEKI